MLTTTTIVAVALGFAPVNASGTVERSRDNYAAMVGRFSDSVELDGKRHVRGINRWNGLRYNLIIGEDGEVRGLANNCDVSFRIQEA